MLETELGSSEKVAQLLIAELSLPLPMLHFIFNKIYKSSLGFPLMELKAGVGELPPAQADCFSEYTHHGLDLPAHILIPLTLQLDFGSSVQ